MKLHPNGFVNFVISDPDTMKLTKNKSQKATEEDLEAVRKRRRWEDAQLAQNEKKELDPIDELLKEE